MGGRKKKEDSERSTRDPTRRDPQPTLNKKHTNTTTTRPTQNPKIQHTRARSPHERTRGANKAAQTKPVPSSVASPRYFFSRPLCCLLCALVVGDRRRHARYDHARRRRAPPPAESLSPPPRKKEKEERPFSCAPPSLSPPCDFVFLIVACSSQPQTVRIETALLSKHVRYTVLCWYVEAPFHSSCH